MHAAPDTSPSSRERLLRVARARFAEDGYAATSLDAIVADAGVTKGSLYHHFTNKAELFEGVFEAEQERLARDVAAKYASKRDPWQAAYAGMRAFLDLHLDPGTQRITLVDAPSALGWQRMRELREPYGLALMRAGLQALADTGRLRHRSLDALATLLFGALCEGALAVAAAADPAAARRRMERELKTMLGTLAPRD